MTPEQRLQKHLTNHDGFTSKAKDWQIVHQEYFGTKQAAYSRELEVKSKKSRKYIENLISNKA